VIDLTQEKLHELFSYNQETGAFSWRVKKSRNVKVGVPINSNNGKGYKTVKIDGKTYLVHRLVWMYVYGKFPENDIDHKNRIRSDNRLVNLREASRSDNCQNISIPSHNKSGHIGVSWIKNHKSWTVYIKVERKNKWLGYYKNLDAAIAARKQGEKKYYNLPESVPC
jgi:hypothetical protein